MYGMESNKLEENPISSETAQMTYTSKSSLLIEIFPPFTAVNGITGEDRN